MPLPKEYYTADDYWNLPEGERAELIDGQFYAMAPPNTIHQNLVSEFTRIIGNFIKSNNGKCKVFPAPFAVNLDADSKNWIEPDISVICDKNKLTDKCCSGAPDWIIEVVSPSSRKMDYLKKTIMYLDSGVHEYWIVDPTKERTTIYQSEEDVAPVIIPFNQPIAVGIFTDLNIVIAELLD